MRDSDKFKLFTFCVVALVVGMVVYKIVSTSSRVTAIEVEHSRQKFWDSWDKWGTLNHIKHLEREVAHPEMGWSDGGYNRKEAGLSAKQLVKFLVYAGQRGWIDDDYGYSTYKRGPSLIEACNQWVQQRTELSKEDQSWVSPPRPRVAWGATLTRTA